jgi:hypothetical protein
MSVRTSISPDPRVSNVQFSRALLSQPLHSIRLAFDGFAEFRSQIHSQIGAAPIACSAALFDGVGEGQPRIDWRLQATGKADAGGCRYESLGHGGVGFRVKHD